MNNTKKIVRINYTLNDTLYLKSFRVNNYDDLDDPYDFFKELLAQRKSVSKEDINIENFIVCDSNDNILYEIKLK